VEVSSGSALEGAAAGPKLDHLAGIDLAVFGPEKVESADQPPLAEENAQHFGDGKYHLTVGDIQEKLLPYPLGPFLPPFRMAGWAKSTATT